MKKTMLFSLVVGLIFQTYSLRAEESPSPSASVTPLSESAASAAPVELAPVTLSVTPEASLAPVMAVTTTASAAVTTTPSMAVAANTSAANPASATSENLEFVSGEITSTDEAAKTVTVKLYGETENATNDKILTIKLDESTDITDGEKDRDIKSLTNGTEVDVEYDPATSKATYIFVY